MANRLMESIPESYFKTAMVSTTEPGPLPLINLAVGIPDGRTPDIILEAVGESVYLEENQRYGEFRGKQSFKDAIIRFYREQYGVALGEDNIAILYGTKSALVQFPMMFIEPGEGVFLPDPGYPDYAAGVKLARGEIYNLPLLAENNFLPDYSRLPKDALANARLMYLNYPSNPLGAVATKEFFDETVERFRDTKTRIVHDFAYAPFAYSENHPSILQSDCGFDCAIEIYSMSKGFNMSGFRVGFAVGNREMIEAINTFQDHTQTGMWGVLQDAAKTALQNADDIIPAQREKFKQRSAMVTAAFRETGIPINPIDGGIFGWIRVPEGYDGETFRDYLVRELSILVTPGAPFGGRGRDYIRISLAVPNTELETVIERFSTIRNLWDDAHDK